jgi:hypothetical protein
MKLVVIFHLNSISNPGTGPRSLYLFDCFSKQQWISDCFESAPIWIGSRIESTSTMRIINDVKLDFKDVLIRPKRSKLKSRRDVDVSRTFTFVNSKRTLNCVSDHSLIKDRFTAKSFFLFLSVAWPTTALSRCPSWPPTWIRPVPLVSDHSLISLKTA